MIDLSKNLPEDFTSATVKTWVYCRVGDEEKTRGFCHLLFCRCEIRRQPCPVWAKRIRKPNRGNLHKSIPNCHSHPSL